LKREIRPVTSNILTYTVQGGATNTHASKAYVLVDEPERQHVVSFVARLLERHIHTFVIVQCREIINEPSKARQIVNPD
jgi:hypothetical protein